MKNQYYISCSYAYLNVRSVHFPLWVQAISSIIVKNYQVC